jgi:hypothetical protein
MNVSIDAGTSQPSSEPALIARVIRGNPWLFIAGLMIVGAYLRLANLGDLGIHSDEDISWITAKLILEKGVPQFPSGLMYVRGGAYLYITAASVWLFGLSEFAIRLPAVLFGLLTIPLAFVFAKRLFGVAVGLLVATLITFSHWDIEVARYARFYSAFGFFALLTVLCIWEHRVRSERLAGGITCVALAIFCITLHELGYAIALMFLIPPLLTWDTVRHNPSKLVFPLVTCLTIGIFFLVWRHVISAGYSVPLTTNPRATTPNFVNPAFGGTFDEGVKIGPVSVPLTIPNLSILHALQQTAPVLAVLLAGMGSIGVVSLWRKYRSSFSTVDTVLLCAAATLSALQLFNLAILAIVLLAASRVDGIRGFRHPPVLLAAAVVGVCFVAWMGLAVGLNLHPVDASARAPGVIRQLLDYPRFTQVWGYAREWPLASIVALVGGLWAFDRVMSRSNRDVAAGFLLLVFAIPLLVNGLLEHDYQGFRYNIPFDSYYWCFVALGLCKWRVLLPASLRDVANGHSWRMGTVALAALVLLDVNPARAWLVAHRDYTNTGLPYRVYRIPERRDFKTPTAYVTKHAAPNDLVVAIIDAREVYCYLGRLDYWVMSSHLTQAYYDGEMLREKYVLTPLLTNLTQLQDVLTEAPGRRKWLIASEATVRNTFVLSDDIKHFVLNSQDHVAYVGGDHATKVYLFE